MAKSAAITACMPSCPLMPTPTCAACPCADTGRSSQQSTYVAIKAQLGFCVPSRLLMPTPTCAACQGGWHFNQKVPQSKRMQIWR